MKCIVESKGAIQLMYFNFLIPPQRQFHMKYFLIKSMDNRIFQIKIFIGSLCI